MKLSCGVLTVRGRFPDLEDGEVYDARKKPEFIRSSAVVRYPMSRGYPRPPTLRRLLNMRFFLSTLEISSSGGKILDFGQNMAGYVRFHVCEPEGTKITRRLFEASDHGEYSDISLSFPAGDVAPGQTGNHLHRLR